MNPMYFPKEPDYEKHLFQNYRDIRSVCRSIFRLQAG